MSEQVTPPTWAVVGEEIGYHARPIQRPDWVRPATVVSVGKVYITVLVRGMSQNERFRMDRGEMIDGTWWLTKREPGVASFFLGPMDSDRYRSAEHEQTVRAYAQRADSAATVFTNDHTVENAKRAIALFHAYVRAAEAS